MTAGWSNGVGGHAAEARGHEEAGDGVERERVSYTPLDINFITRRLDMALSQMHGEFSARIGLATPELVALMHLSASPEGLGPTELAHRLHITTGAMTAMLDRLASYGHVERAPHPSDRRKLVVRITPHARDEAMIHIGPLRDELVALAERLTPSERDVVGRFLDGAVDIVERHAGRPPEGDRGAPGREG